MNPRHCAVGAGHSFATRIQPWGSAPLRPMPLVIAHCALHSSGRTCRRSVPLRCARAGVNGEVAANDSRGDAEEVVRSPLTSVPGTKARSRQRPSWPGERWPEDRRLAGLGLRAEVICQLGRALARARGVSHLGASHRAWSRPPRGGRDHCYAPGLAAATGGLAGGVSWSRCVSDQPAAPLCR